ncbi:hypothetical protein ACSTK0_24635, partial [Vibrio parahaemolyticus]
PAGPHGRAAAPPEQIRRPDPGFVALVATIGLLSVIGLVMVLSASSDNAVREGTSPWLYFERQVLWVAVG